jgi:hypothetical protein
MKNETEYRREFEKDRLGEKERNEKRVKQSDR